MAEVVLFHHAQGLTRGCRSFADGLRRAGHSVRLPDLYDGRTFASLADGVAHAEAIGMEAIIERGRAAVGAGGAGLVFGGFSLGALPAQMLAQTTPACAGALLLHACEPPEVFGSPWPPDVPLQIHTSERDEWVDLDVARALAASSPRAELFVYPGDRHLFADDSLPEHDQAAAALLGQRVLAFLDAVG